MDNLGILDIERLAYVPKKHWKAHEFCFYLHDQITTMLVEYERSGAPNLVVEAFRSAIKEHNLDLKNVDLIDFLKEHELTAEYQHHIVKSRRHGTHSGHAPFPL